MQLLNSSFANALGRPDLVYGSKSASVGPPPTMTIMGGSTAAGDTGPLTGGGRGALIMLMALIGAYASFTWWVRPYIA
jgi:hypothetical protein